MIFTHHQHRAKHNVWLIVLVFLLASLPFLVPYRQYPDSGLFVNMVVACLSLSLIIIVFRYYRFSLEFYCLLYLTALFLIQGLFVHDYYYRWITVVLALTLMAFLLAGVQALSEGQSRQVFKMVVCGVVVGGVLSAVIGMVQYFAPERSVLGIVFLKSLSAGQSHGEVGGNLAQRNQLATYLMVTVVMMVYAVQRGWVSRISGWLFLPFMAFVITLTSSRTVLVEAVFLILFCVVLYLTRYRFMPTPAIKSWRLCPDFRIAGNNPLLLLVFFCFSLLVFQALVSGAGIGRTGAYDISTGRLAEWQKVLHIIKDNPFGVGQDYPWASVVYAINQQGNAEVPSQTWANTHNLILQLLVMFGVWSTPLILIGGWLYFRLFKSDLEEGSGGVIFLCLSFILIHSMFEYPLWSLPFLALFIVLWGLAKGSSDRFKTVKTQIPIVFALAGLFLVIATGMQYYRLIHYYLPTFDVDQDTIRVNDLYRISMNPLLLQDSDVYLLDYLVIAQDRDWEFKYCKVLSYMRAVPAPSLFERLALQELVVEHYEESMSILKARYMLYPQMNDAYLRNMMRYYFPKVAEEQLNRIDRARFDGFPGVKPFLLEYPAFCKPKQK